MGIIDLNKKYDLEEIVKGDAIFCATAITDSMNLKGVFKENNTNYVTETFVTYKSSIDKNTSIIKSRVNFDNNNK